MMLEVGKLKKVIKLISDPGTFNVELAEAAAHRAGAWSQEAKGAYIANAQIRHDATGEAHRESFGAVTAALDSVAGRINTSLNAAEIFDAAEAAERRLDTLGLKKSERTGAVFYLSEAGPSAKSYGYSKAELVAQIQRRSDGTWVLTHVARTNVWPQSPRQRFLYLTPAQRDAAINVAINRCRLKFDVQPQASA
ncbi:MAG: hypothetical protein HKL99_12920 [Burkholderiales bacterium]|nr:hypothetical protein [Burkholderiales bacterium]